MNITKNKVLQTIDGDNITVLDRLGEGGQGTVYKVSYKGAEYALKYYKKPEGEVFYKNLKRNVEKGSPAPTFLWPIAVTQLADDDTFGYIMDLRPSDYKELSKFLMNKVKFKDFSALINTAILICTSFKLLHNKGLSYQDLNDGNFFINPDTGDLLICDNDNVAPDKENLGIQGKPRYMAPEVVSGTYKPDTYSDRFSLAVILFLLLYRGHPLEGARNDNDADPDENALNLYCKSPVFVYDKTDTSNRPRPNVDINVINLWDVYPPFMKDIFTRAFDKSLMNSTGEGRCDRIIDKEWIKTFIHLKESIIACPYCGEDTFFAMKKDMYGCMECGKQVKRPCYLEIGRTCIPLQVGRHLYLYEIDDSKDYTIDVVKAVVGTVIENKKQRGVWGLKNQSDITWYRRSPGGKEETRARDEVIPIIRENKIKFGTLCEGIIK